MVQGGVLQSRPTPATGFTPRRATRRRSTSSLRRARTTPTSHAYGTGNGGYTDPVNYLTPVGAFADSPGPYGTYDMGGDVWEWNESPMGPSRALRGGGWNGISNYLASSIRATNAPTYEVDCLGFRVASVLLPGDANCDGTVDGADLTSCCRITTRPARPGPRATLTATVRSMAPTSTLCSRITIRTLGCPRQVLRCPSRQHSVGRMRSCGGFDLEWKGSEVYLFLRNLICLSCQNRIYAVVFAIFSPCGVAGGGRFI